MARKSLTEQAQKVVAEEYSKPPPDPAVEDAAEDDSDYWNNLDEVELHNIQNMMEAWSKHDLVSETSNQMQQELRIYMQHNSGS